MKTPQGFVRQSSSGALLVLILCLLAVCSTPAAVCGQAQSKFVLQGTIVEVETGEPVPLVTVKIDSLQLGTVANLDGFFSFELPPGRYTLLVEAIGYEKAQLEVDLTQGPVTDVKIELDYRASSLETVVIKPGVNPAMRIVNNAIKNRKNNRLEGIDVYEYESYNKTTITLNNITKKKLDKSLVLHPTKKFIREREGDTALVDSNRRYKIGIFISETIASVYYRKPDRKEIVRAKQTTGSDQTDETNMVQQLLANVEVYDNYIQVLEKEFVSPLATGATMNYAYMLLDTIFVGQDSIFGIQIIPKRKFDKVFRGVMYIESGSWALKKLDVRMNADPNINFVEDIRIRQEYDQVDGRWVPVVKDVEIDFQNGKDATGLLGRTVTVYRNYKIGEERETRYYRGELQEVDTGAFEKDSTFWRLQRGSPLEKSDELAYEFMEDLRKRTIWQIILTINEAITVGKKRFGPIDVGPYSRLSGFNPVEGFRTQLGVYTNHTLSRRYQIGGHLAYGFKDERLKYQVEGSYKISMLPRVQVGFRVAEEIEQMGFVNYAVDGRGLLNSVAMRVPLRKLNYYTERYGSVSVDFFRGGYGTFSLRTYEFNPAFPFYYIAGDELRSSYSTTELGFSLRLSFREEYVLRHGERIYTGSKYPVLYGTVDVGRKGLLGGEFDYVKASASITDKFKMGRLGWMNYTASVGKIFGDVPYASLQVFRGNQSYAIDPSGNYVDALLSYLGERNRTSAFDRVSFNLMYFYEFVADEYFELGFDHHFEGWIFNKLPLLRRPLHYLKWKEVVTFRMATGRISAENRRINSPLLDPRFAGLNEIRINASELIPVRTPEIQPYYEVGVGVENIFRFLRVDFIWRLNYLNPVAPAELQGFNYNFGVRFNIFFQF